MLYFLYILKIRTKRGEQMNQTALLNGDVIAVNSKNEVFEACLIEGDKIEILGTTDEIQKTLLASTVKFPRLTRLKSY